MAHQFFNGATALPIEDQDVAGYEREEPVRAQTPRADVWVPLAQTAVEMLIVLIGLLAVGASLRVTGTAQIVLRAVAGTMAIAMQSWRRYSGHAQSLLRRYERVEAKPQQAVDAEPVEQIELVEMRVRYTCEACGKRDEHEPTLPQSVFDKLERIATLVLRGKVTFSRSGLVSGNFKTLTRSEYDALLKELLRCELLERQENNSVSLTVRGRAWLGQFLPDASATVQENV